MMDPTLARVAGDLGKVAASLDTRVLLVGAWARDLCLGPTSSGTRATSDADFAVMIDSWADLDTFLDHCGKWFGDIHRINLTLRHLETRLRVDIAPCGPIEAPTGRLHLRNSDRTLNTSGLVECFKHGHRLLPESAEVLVPPPAGFLILKLFAFLDRRERRDLRDLGYVLHNFPVDEGVLWEDQALLEAFEDTSLTFEDAPFWQAGRSLAATFSPTTVAAVVSGLEQLLQERPDIRALIVEDVHGVARHERWERADRALATFARGCRGR